MISGAFYATYTLELFDGMGSSTFEDCFLAGFSYFVLTYCLVLIGFYLEAGFEASLDFLTYYTVFFCYCSSTLVFTGFSSVFF